MYAGKAFGFANLILYGMYSAEFYFGGLFAIVFFIFDFFFFY